MTTEWFTKTAISFEKPKAVDVLKRLGINMSNNSYALKEQNTLRPIMKIKITGRKKGSSIECDKKVQKDCDIEYKIKVNISI